MIDLIRPHEQREARTAYEQQAVRAYEKMQATGLHFTADEMKQWAQSLSNPNATKSNEVAANTLGELPDFGQEGKSPHSLTVD
jgi:hypothetical protein